MVWTSVTEGPKLLVKTCTISNFTHFRQECLQIPVPGEGFQSFILSPVLLMLVQAFWKSPSCGATKFRILNGQMMFSMLE